MRFFKNLFKKRQQQPKSFDNIINVVITTNEKLSKDQRNAIFRTVRDGIISGEELDDIAI